MPMVAGGKRQALRYRYFMIRPKLGQLHGTEGASLLACLLPYREVSITPSTRMLAFVQRLDTTSVLHPG